MKPYSRLIISLVLLSLIAGACLSAPMMAPYSFRDQNLLLGAIAPCRDHWFGTDTLGRDLLSRILYGGRISFLVGLLATLTAGFLGVTYGLIAGYARSTLDHCMMTVVDVFYSLPYVIFVILLMVFLGKGLMPLFIAIGAVEWLVMARVIRGQVIFLKNQPFVHASKALGQSTTGVLIKHILPNLTHSILVCITLTIPKVMLLEAFLSFLGIGIQLPNTSWGNLISDGVSSMENYPWLLIFPCIFFSTTVLLFNIIGDAIHDLMNPRKLRM